MTTTNDTTDEITSSSTGTEVATVAPSAGALALRADQVGWNEVQVAAFSQIGIADAPDPDRQVFLHVCQRTGLDPWSRQIYLIGRDKYQGRQVVGKTWTIQTGIDGFRVISQRNPEYAGIGDPEWQDPTGRWRDTWPWADPNKRPLAARVRVYRSDWQVPATGVVMWHEFAADNKMWRTKGAHMLAKCAEALAHRKAFPHDLAGLLIPEEMDAEQLRPRRPARGMVIEQERTPAPTTEQLTGQPAGQPTVAPAEQPPATDAGPDAGPESTAPAAAPPTGNGDTTAAPQGESAGGGAERMLPAQQRRLFALLRETDIDDRMTWASGQLGREITSYGQLTERDASVLITRLEAGLAALAGTDDDSDTGDGDDGVHDAEIVTDP
jgi:phage recombination protein Bet